MFFFFSNRLPPDNSLICQLCGIQFNSVEMFQAHMQGNKHQVRLDQKLKASVLCTLLFWKKKNQNQISHNFLHLFMPLVIIFNCISYSSGRRKCKSCANPSRRSTIHSQMSSQITFRSRKLVESPRSLQSSRRGPHRRTVIGREKGKCHLRGMSHNCTNLH